MNRCLVILFLFVSSLSLAGDRMCGVGPCPNPVANCVYTLDKGMVTETFEVWGDVRVTTDPTMQMCGYMLLSLAVLI